MNCGKNVKFDLNVIVEGDVSLGDDITEGAYFILKDCSIGKGTVIYPFSLEESAVFAKIVLGPYGRIRLGVSVGDFIEIKKLEYRGQM